MKPTYVRCEACGSFFIWGKTIKGKWMKLEPMTEKIFQGAMTRSAEGEFLSENRGRRKRMAEHHIPHYRMCRAIQKLPVAIRELMVIALVEARQEDRERKERHEERSYYKSTIGNNYKSGHH